MSRRKDRLWETLRPGLFCFKDSCNVYVLKKGDGGVAVDFGAGAWLDALPQIGVKTISHVLLTHAHRDQCAGLANRPAWPFAVHASAEDLRFYRPDTLAGFWKSYQAGGCPANYAAPRPPLPFVKGDLADAQELVWQDTVFGVIPTPGHTRGALTYLAVWDGKAVAFCGDALHAGGTVHQPYHLEWDHWTGDGALAAWHGLTRLGDCRVDLLCPSHGPVVTKKSGACIRQAQQRVMAFVRAKGSVCAGERDRWFETQPLACSARQVLPDLYHFGGNSFLLAGDGGEGFVVDPTLPSIERVTALMEEVGVRTVTAATASHYHRDHSDGMDWLRDRYGTAVWLHPWVAEPIVDRDRYDVPWLPVDSITSDRLLPAQGRFRWNRYRFDILPFPGQTRWHCGFHTDIAGQRVLFSGDCYQPPSRWNGTGGFCAFNGSRFAEGFAGSAGAVLHLAPDLICNGHGCIYRYHAGHYRRIVRWAEQAEKAVRNLCPSDAWLADYDCRAAWWEPFRSRVKAGGTVALCFVVHNYREKPIALTVALALPEGWTASPEMRRMRVQAGAVRSAGFEVAIPGNTPPGRYVIAADVTEDGRIMGETAAALVDVEIERMQNAK